MESKPFQSPATDANLHDEIDARARLIACMQDLINGLGQANLDLAHELGVRRQLAAELDDGQPIAENESLVITCGHNALLSLPESGDWIPLPHPEQNGNESKAALSKKNGSQAGSILVTRWRPVPRLIELRSLLAGYPVARQAQLVSLATEVVCLELARPILGRAFMKSLMRTGEFGIIISDGSGVVRMVNRNFCQLAGQPPGALIGRSMTEGPLAAEEEPSGHEPTFEESADLKTNVMWIRGGNNTRRRVRLFSQSISSKLPRAGSVSVALELTGQQQQIEPLASREQLYRQFFEEDVTGDYSCTPDGKIIACNPAFARIFGFSSVEEAAKCNLRQLHTSGEAADTFVDTLKRHRQLNCFKTVMRRVDGKRIHVICNVHGTFDSQGELIEITGYIFDNTEQKLSEEKVRESQKMESVGRLAGGVAHDFNNLLLTIQGYASLLADRRVLDSEGQEAIEQIQKASDRAAVLTRQLLAFGRRQVLQPTKLNLNEIISGMSSLLQRMLGEDIELVAQLDADLGAVHADRTQLEQVLFNLAANARDAMPSGGRLTLTTANAILRDTWFSSHEGSAPGNYVELSVHDNGVGMGDEVKRHLFEPFFTTKERGRGTGLGLPTVYGIIKQSGGEIQACSAVGEGSTFKIYLPRLAAESVEVTPARIQGAPPEKTTILLVEDEEAVRTLIKNILLKHGYDIVAAADGREALTRMEEHTGRVSLLLTDLIMPQMNGRELYEHLCLRFPGLEVIYLSDCTEDEFVKKGVKQEKIKLLKKPFKPREMVEKITQVLESA